MYKIAGGGNNSAAIRSDGTVVVWGGMNETPPLGPCIEVACGNDFTIVVTTDHRAIKFNGATRDTTGMPIEMGTVISVAAGDWHTTARREDGHVISWEIILLGSAMFHQSLVLARKLQQAPFIRWRFQQVVLSLVGEMTVIHR